MVICADYGNSVSTEASIFCKASDDHVVVQGWKKGTVVEFLNRLDEASFGSYAVYLPESDLNLAVLDMNPHRFKSIGLFDPVDNPYANKLSMFVHRFIQHCEHGRLELISDFTAFPDHFVEWSYTLNGALKVKTDSVPRWLRCVVVAWNMARHAIYGGGQNR